jgi:sporadic carbohydrate cluster 2OG-Fe(II) oxygenase
MDMNKIHQDFQSKNYLIFENENDAAFTEFHAVILKAVQDASGKAIENLGSLHKHVKREDINPIRIKAFQTLNNVSDWKMKYYSLAQTPLKELFGPDISIQMKLNLSIQMPGDASSILELHSDTLSGQSPFECVLWTAINDAFDSNAMYMFDIAESQKLYQMLPSYQHKGMNQLYEDNKQKAEFLSVKAGTNILFSSTLFHGNTLNETEHTRVSLNCRFKALFSPEYSNFPHERVTGTFYEPLLISPITRIGLAYNDQIEF